MPLERYVPASGLTLPDGSFIPASCSVGLNPYIIGRNKTFWGDDADEFRPERWLQKENESDSVYEERVRSMRATELAFGAGARMCMGRHLAMLEVYKMVATLVSRFEIELVDPEKEWKVVWVWFPRQSGIVCNLRRRGGEARK